MDAALEVIKELKGMLRERTPSIDEFTALFPEILYTDQVTKGRALVKCLLTMFHSEQEKALTVEYDTMTIEHLVPQSRIGQDGLTENIVGQIGDLILVSAPANVKLGNKSFPEKKKILEIAGFSLPQEVANTDDWAQMKSRAARMAWLSMPLRNSGRYSANGNAHRAAYWILSSDQHLALAQHAQGAAPPVFPLIRLRPSKYSKGVGAWVVLLLILIIILIVILISNDEEDQD